MLYRLLIVATLTSGLVPAVLSAQRPADRLMVARYLDLETVADPRLSPDGRQVVYTRRWINRLTDRWESALWIMDADGGRNRFLATGSGPQWSPDGTRIAYVAPGAERGSGPQVFVRWMDPQGLVTQVTREPTGPTDLKWSPDGTSIGFARLVPATVSWPIPLPSAPEGATWTPAPRILDRLHTRQDRVGFQEPGDIHLFVVPADGGTGRQITTGSWQVGARFDGLGGSVGWDWMPDGTEMVVDGYDLEDRDLNYRNADIWGVNVATGERRKLTTAPGVWTSPIVSPDGKYLAYAGYPATTASYHAAGVYLLAFDGSAPRPLSVALDRDAEELAWASDGSGVYFSAEDEGNRNLYFTPRSGGVKPVTTGTHVVSLGSLAKNVAVGVRSTWHRPSDVVRVNLKKPSEITRLTDVNDDLLRGVRLGEVEEIRLRSSGDARVQAWVVKPPDFEPGRRYPLILEIHGGPHGMYNTGFSYFFQSLAAAGYVVLYVNPRGSTGYGSAFGNAIERAYPSVDYDDLMAAVDSVVARGYAHDHRMYVGGCSGGGVLSSWVIGHTTRFAAAAVRCPVTNWLSFAGQTDVPLFTYNFFRAPFWEDPEPWLRQSPLMYVGNVTTPTLLMTGVLDLRTPMPQTEEYFAALTMRGVPSKLIRFEGEFHGTTSRPSNFMRTVLYMLDWYGRYPAQP